MAITVIPPISLADDVLQRHTKRAPKKTQSKKPLGAPPLPPKPAKPETAASDLLADLTQTEPPVVPAKKPLGSPHLQAQTSPQPANETTVELTDDFKNQPPKRHFRFRLERGRARAASIKRVTLLPAQNVTNHVKKTSFNSWLLVSYAVLLAATQLVMVGYNIAGLYLNSITLGVLMAVALWRQDARKLSISLAILPIVNMVSSTILTSTAFRTASVYYGVLLVLALLYRYLFTLDEPVQSSQLKIKGHAFGIPLMLVLGEVVGVIGYGLLRHHYPYLHVSLPLVATACVIFAFAEEMFLRGLVQQQASNLVSPLLAAGLTSVLYVCVSVGASTPLTIIPAVAMGTVLSAVYYYKHNLLLSTTVNAAAKLTYVGLVATFVIR